MDHGTRKVPGVTMLIESQSCKWPARYKGLESKTVWEGLDFYASQEKDNWFQGLGRRGRYGRGDKGRTSDLPESRVGAGGRAAEFHGTYN